MYQGTVHSGEVDAHEEFVQSISEFLLGAGGSDF